MRGNPKRADTKKNAVSEAKNTRFAKKIFFGQTILKSMNFENILSLNR